MHTQLFREEKMRLADLKIEPATGEMLKTPLFVYIVP